MGVREGLDHTNTRAKVPTTNNPIIMRKFINTSGRKGRKPNQAGEGPKRGKEKLAMEGKG